MSARESGVAKSNASPHAGSANRRIRTTGRGARYGIACAFVVLLIPSGMATARETNADAEIPNVLVTDKRMDAHDHVRGSKIALPAIDLPLSAERIDTASIEQTGFRGLGSLLQATTSVTTQASDGNAFNDFLLRGFSNTPVYRNGINDSVGDRPARSLANVDYIEVLKGPYGALYGPGEPGGSINFVTKRPASEFATELRLGFGSFSEMTLGLDTTGPLPGTENLNYRLIAQTNQGDTFRDFIKDEQVFVNPMLSWQATPTLRFDASFEYIADDRLFDNGLPAIGGAVTLPFDRFLGEPDSGTGRIDSYTFQFTTLIDLAHSWQFELSLNGQKADIAGQSVEPDELVRESGSYILNRSATRSEEVSRALVAQAEIDGIAVYLGLPHHLLFGASATGFNDDTEFYASDPDDDPYAIDVFSPRYGARRPVPLAERASAERTRQYSVYAQDLLEIGAHWRVLLGLRFDHIEQAGSDAVALTRFDRTLNEVSPRAGLVFKPYASWSLFASYSESIDPNEGLRPDGSGLDPTKSRALETGVKWHSERYPVAADVSVFAIKQSNVTTEAPGNPGFELQTGKQESIGADVEIRAQATDWLSLTTRYSFVDAQILSDTFIRNGTTPLNVGKHQLSVLALAKGSWLKPQDLSFAVSMNYLSERQGSLEPDELSLRLPGYVRTDVFIGWRYSDRLRFDFRVENLADERYIRSSQSDALHLMPGIPRTFRGELSLSF